MKKESRYTSADGCGWGPHWSIIGGKPTFGRYGNDCHSYIFELHGHLGDGTHMLSFSLSPYEREERCCHKHLPSVGMTFDLVDDLLVEKMIEELRAFLENRLKHKKLSLERGQRR